MSEFPSYESDDVLRSAHLSPRTARVSVLLNLLGELIERRNRDHESRCGKCGATTRARYVTALPNGRGKREKDHSSR